MGAIFLLNRGARRDSLDKQRAAVARQREAARKQAENLGMWLPIGADPKLSR